MRVLCLASFVILPLIFYYALRNVTGDGLSAVVLGLILFVTLLSWFGGRPATAGGPKKW